MFLIAITDSDITGCFQSMDVERIPFNGSTVTVVTDRYLSHTIATPQGFSIVESPLPPSPQLATSDKAILARVDFDKNKGTINIYKPTNAGKTIYHHINQQGGLYCSTHISLLRKAGVTLKEESTALPEYFLYGYTMSPLTLLKGIEEVPVGGRICVELENGKCSIKSRSNFIIPEVREEPGSIDTIARRVSDLLTKSIEYLRPLSERISVPFSGGLDSTILYTACKDLYGVDKTFSTGYPFEDAKGNIEKEYALSASKALGTVHHYFEATPTDYLEGIIETIEAAEGPLAYTQSVMFYLFYRDGIPEDKNILISGRGAESAFGVHLHDDIYTMARMPWKLLSWRPFLRLIELASPLTRHGLGFVRNVRAINDCPISDPDNIIWTSRAYASRDWLMKYLDVSGYDIISRRYNNIKPFEERSIYEVVSIMDLLADSSYSQSTWSKIAEKSGKVLYHPFSDIDLLNYVYSVPWKIKFHPPKNILKHVASQNNIPQFIINRPKSGFSVHTPAKWMELLTLLAPLCREVFSKDDFLSLKLETFQETMTLWHMINYSIWKRLFINGESVGELLEELRSETRYSMAESRKE